MSLRRKKKQVHEAEVVDDDFSHDDEREDEVYLCYTFNKKMDLNFKMPVVYIPICI